MSEELNEFDNSTVKDTSAMKPEPRKEGCQLVNVSFDEEKEQLVFDFKDAHGAVLQHREFKPKQLENQTAEKFKEAKDALKSRIVHICNRFIPEDQTKAIKSDDGSWSSYCKNIIKALGESYKGKKIALKVIYNNKNFASLPKYPDFISSALKPTEFKNNPNFDKFEISKATPDTEAGANAGAMGAGAKSEWD